MSFSSDIKEKLLSPVYECGSCSQAMAAGRLAVMIEDDGESGAFREKLLSEGIPGRECCERAFLRGAFLKSGSVSDPLRSWHLEIDARRESEARLIADIMEKHEIHRGITERKGRYIVYVKDCDSIAAMLGTIGAGADALQLFGIQAEKSVRNDINRRVNFESANMKKSIKAASKYIKAVNKLKEAGKWESLPQILKEIGSLRVQYPDISLKELGELLSPPIGKSGVNHRLNRILRAAASLRDN